MKSKASKPQEIPQGPELAEEHLLFFFPCLLKEHQDGDNLSSDMKEGLLFLSPDYIKERSGAK